MLEYMKKNLTFFELLSAGILFVLFFSNTFTFSEIIVNILSFIVFLEVIKVISGFITQKEHIIQLRTVIDGFIVFFLRDLVLIFSNEKITIIEKEHKILVLAGILTLLFIFRILSIRFSPNDKNCEKCIAITEEQRKKIIDKNN